ncbi:isopeptide-forming domain-containing fimbrial protein [Hassallia byssoidea VB512170]|uniref:Isopeptide-forming domain-containing fimbrial protein n=1 Tax=Hassallia byssoidea VB512170 TaxID=1304833 RepID=A0A846HEL7_9CYAN|nr:isopeptide-forming domain-containing fimbrial protein [Hassalia byssoidea]NEU75060.1 isopeptide-forming domain-containing fimbrial protein [Hassalia byssoidea VB512170]
MKIPAILLTTTFSYQSLLLFTASPVFAQVTPQLCAIPGRDSPIPLSGIINTYYPSQANTTISPGATSIPVGTPTNGALIQPGDLLLVIQMQAADINSSNTDAYGDGIAGGGNSANTKVAPSGGATGASGYTNSTAGNYEYVVATSSVSGNSISIKGTGSGGGLRNSYSNADFGTQGQRRYQVIRVPQYSSASVNSTLTAAPWNGSTGGVLVYDVAGNLNLNNATVDVTGKGFRGGGGRFFNGEPGLSFNDYRTLSTQNANGSKGEGIAGTPRFLIQKFNNTTGNSLVTPQLIDNINEGYPNGSYGRGAPGTAGGGATDGNPGGTNNENSGGGGGGNGGFGGLGGESWNSQRFIGGFGGTAFGADVARVVLGGGGGSGSSNNRTSIIRGILPDGLASSGAPGGGMVLIRTGSVSGNGAIAANGDNAYNVENDGGGGGGAGGSVVVTAANNNLTGLTVNANGGRGGDVRFVSPHGPGGGGGGGVVFSSSGAVVNVSGGTPGGTGDPIDPTQNFGSTTGSSGVSAAAGSIPGANSGAECLPILTVNKTTSTPGPLNKPSKASYTITVSNTVNRGTALNVNITDTLPAGFTFDGSSTPTINVTGGATRNAINNATAGATTVNFGTFDIPGGATVEITFTTDISATVADGVYQNSATATYLDPTRTTANGTTSTSYDAANPGEDVTVASLTPTIRKSVRFLRDNDGTKTVTVGDDVQYTIIVTNPNPASSVDNLVISDRVPAQLQILQDSENAIEFSSGFNVASTLPNNSFNGTGNSIIFSNPGTVPPNSTVTVTYNARILPNSETRISNIASINFTGDNGKAIVSDASDTINPNLPGSGVNSGNPDANGNVNQPTGDGINPDPTIINFINPPQLPQLRGVKRITNVIRNGASINNVNFHTFIDDQNDDTDNAAGWSKLKPVGVPIISPQIRLQSGDEVEYTVYFLSDGNQPVQNAKFCDSIPNGTKFIPDSFGSGSGILVNILNKATPQTNTADSDNASFFSPLAPLPANNVCSNQNNLKGAAIANFGNLDNTTGNNYGFVRFRVKID